MSYTPCILIPIYNHKDAITATVARLRPHGLPILIVDDGSDAPTQAVLAQLQHDNPDLHFFRLPENGGKGAAVMHGMLQARALGFSHALQIDADGQHDVGDLPAFIDYGRGHPDALVCGKPIYDDSVPKGRLYGRYVTHVWVWIETLSFDIADSMCGFRLYPVAATCALIESVQLPCRMDFDTEIVVRLYWRGLPVHNIATRVRYPENGLSHFRMLEDNIRISKMHTRLFFGMLPRIPLLLWRKLAGRPTAGNSHWSQLAEQGGALGLRILFACYRLFGARLTQLMLYPVVAYFFLAAGSARRASHDYLLQLHHFRADMAQPAPTWIDTFRHMLAFAQSGLDKLAAWSGRMPPGTVRFPNQAAFESLLQSGRGAVLVGAHLGNLEMTRALATGRKLATVNAVVYTDHAQRFNRMLEQANADYGANLLQVSALGPDTAILLKDKVEQGELLVIVGDRTPPAENGRISHASFLGRSAAFANGPWLLASLLDCPVYLFFCLRERDGYCIHFEPFSERIILPRKQRQQSLQAHVQQYASRLEQYCLQAPLQWFNFYDFWRSEIGRPADTRAPLPDTATASKP